MPGAAPGFDSGEVRQIAGKVLMRAWQGADAARSRWFKQGEEIARYGYAPDFNFEYQSLPADAFFKAKAALTSESIRLFGPFLYQNNPHRTVTVRPWADSFIAQSAAVMDTYLNYAVTEYDAYANARRAVDQAVCWGRGIRWLGRHPKKPEIIASLSDDVRNFWDDPDADIPEERRIGYRQRIRPREEVIAEYPEAEAALKSLPRHEGKDLRKDQWDGGNTGDSGADMICYLEAYAIVGLYRFEGGKGIAVAMQRNGVQPDDRPYKYLFTKEGKFVHACEWEVPLYLDGEWPWTELDFYDYPSSIWPVSPLEPGLGYQRAINWLITLMMGRARKGFRLIGAIQSTAGEGLGATEEDQVLVGADVEFLKLAVGGGRSINDFIKEFTPSWEWLNQGMQFLNLLEDKYNKATGKYEILYSGTTGTQSRTATDAQVKDRNSQSRLEDMKDRIVKWETRIARKDALAARFLLTRQDIGKVLGPEAAEQWGFMFNPEAIDQQKFAQQLMQSGLPPQEAMAFAQEKFAQAISLDAWRAETAYGIEADSIKRKDIDQKIDSYKELMNQFTPTQIQSPDIRVQALGYATVAGYLNAIGADADLVSEYRELAATLREQALQPPPMPAQPAPEPMPAGAA